MAKQFCFKLDAVLRWRRLQADAQQRVVAQRLRRLFELRGHIETVHAQISDELDLARTAAAQRHPEVQGLSHRRYWVSHLQRLAVQADQEVLAEKRTLATEQQTLVQAVKELRVLEKLRDRARERHRLAAARAEQAELDDGVLGRWVALPPADASRDDP